MVEVALEMLVPYERNAKKHPQEQIEKLKKSIQEFGFISPCLIDRDNRIIAGHGRVEAARQMGMDVVPCVYIEGLTDEQRRAYILADNRLTELGGWDLETVSDELSALRDLNFDITTTGFDIDDILFDEFDEEPLQEEETKEPPEIIISKGEIYQLGRHRLMCGDSTNANDVAKLMGEETADLLETDPPYNVAVKGTAGTIINDNMPAEAFELFLCTCLKNAAQVLKPGGAFYIWHADSNGLVFRQATEAAGLTIKQNLIWIKSHFTIGRQDYQWRHEPCLYGWKEGAGHYFIDVRSLTTVQEGGLENKEKAELVKILRDLLDDIGTVFHEDKPSRNELHPTMKPIGLIKKQIRNSTKEGELVLDLFGGSGTTLIACEEMDRRCFMMEYDEVYASAIIQRWEKETGKKAVKIDA